MKTLDEEYQKLEEEVKEEERQEEEYFITAPEPNEEVV